MSKKYKHIRCTKCRVKDCFISSCLNKGELLEIDKCRNTSIYGTGQLIFHEGNIVSGIYFIHSGKVKVFAHSSGRKEKIFRLAKSGNILGHRGFGGKPVYPVAATALEDSLICYIPVDVFDRILRGSSKLAYQMATFFAEELKYSEERWKNMELMNVGERVADALLYIMRSFRATITEGMPICLYLSRKEIGQIAFTSKEQVSREITKLKAQGIIATSGSMQIVVKDLRSLYKIVEDFYP